MRLLGCLSLLALAACSSGESAKGAASPAAAQAAEPAEGDEHIACAVGGAGDLAKVCAVESADENGTLFLTVRHPDGGFRRFEVLKDGRGLAVADGAIAAANALVGKELEVTVGADRYRFPATVADNAAKP